LAFTSGAEIGVWEGIHAAALCRANPGLHLLCVDAWTPYGGDETQASAADPVFAKRVRRAEEVAQRLLAPLNCTIRRQFSVEAAATVPDASLDFIYIDGAHNFANVMADLLAWVPKVQSGGIISGHDYKHYQRNRQIRVVEAVDAFTRAYDIAPWFVLAGDADPSFLWVQP
jgi:hypothetical protein